MYSVVIMKLYTSGYKCWCYKSICVLVKPCSQRPIRLNSTKLASWVELSRIRCCEQCFKTVGMVVWNSFSAESLGCSAATVSAPATRTDRQLTPPPLEQLRSTGLAALTVCVITEEAALSLNCLSFKHLPTTLGDKRCRH